MWRSKKRFPMILALGLAICIGLSACASEPESETDETTAVSSIYLACNTENGMGDHADDGSAAGQEGWLCYQKLTYDYLYDFDNMTEHMENIKNELYRISVDGTQKEKLAESDNINDFCDITVAGDWIYYEKYHNGM